MWNKLIMRTSEAINAYEEMERQRDEIQLKYDKLFKEYWSLKSQHFVSQLNNPKVVLETINSIISNDDSNISELQEIHDKEWDWKVYSKLKFALEEVDLIKKQQSNKLQQELENAKRLKELEKKVAAQEKIISDLRKVNESYGRLRAYDQEKIKELEKN